MCQEIISSLFLKFFHLVFLSSSHSIVVFLVFVFFFVCVCVFIFLPMYFYLFCNFGYVYKAFHQVTAIHCLFIFVFKAIDFLN